MFEKQSHETQRYKSLLLVTRGTDVTTKIGEFDVKNSRKEKHLGIKIEPSFKNYVPPFAKRQAKSYLNS